MQRYTKNTTSAANNNQSINNTNIDSAKKEKAFPSFENLIFFIDVSKKNEYAKLEDKIKSVGGTIKLFLTDDVTHFITDKASNVQNTNLLNASSPKGSYNCSSPQTPKTPELTDSKPNKITTSRTRSRVDEMIHRARLETSVSQPSLLDVALLKNIRVWDSNFANLYLNKLIKKIKLYKSNIKKGISDKIFLTKPFIKIEDNLGKYRPYYKILKSKWPLVNLINCELDNSKTSKQDLINEKINKKIIKETDNNKIDKFGYCELCKCEYDILSVHLKTEQHYSFASDPKNYEALDKLIDEKISVKYFLEENCSEINNQNIKVPTNMTKLQYHDYFSRSANDSDKALCVQGKINRVTRQGQVNLESNTNGCKKKRSEIVKNNKSSSDNHIKSENHFNYISEVRKSEKEAQNYNSKDNPSLYYKVIKSQSDTVGDLNNKTNDKDLAKPALIVKFRKIRQSELSVLNGEAENFMFPKTKTEIENSKKQNNEQKPNKRKYVNAFSVEEKKDEKIKTNSESKKKSNSSPDSKTKNKESCNNDYLTNLKNLSYSFERIPSSEPWFNVFYRQDTGKEHTFEYFGGTGYKKLPYEMGHVPTVQSKPYLNFCMLCKNKVELNEYKISNSIDELSKKSNELRIKLENDITGIKNVSEHKEKYNNCNHKQQTNCKLQSNQQQIEIQQQLDLQQQQTSVNSQQSVNKPFKKFYLMNLDMPRKSPREHASTLAMLSCLVKKSNSCQNSINNDSKEPTPEPLLNINRNISTPSLENDQDIKFESKELQSQKEIKDDNNSEKYSKRRSKSFYNERIQKLTSVALEKEIDYFLKKSYSDCLEFNNPLTNKFRNSIETEDDDDDEENEEKQKFQNNINLDEILERSLKEDLSYNRPLLLSDGLRINASQKKRPVNKTGWPYKKKLLTRRQKGCITGFHHHKGVLVKKSSPWSNINNNNFRNEDNATNKNNEKILENANVITSFSSNLDDSNNEKLDDKLTRNIDDSLKVENSIIDCQENLQNQNVKNEESPTSNNNNLNSQIVLSTISSVPISDEPINETKSRTLLKTATTTQTVEKNNTNSNSIAPPSPRVLRRPRGRWYRER